MESTMPTKKKILISSVVLALGVPVNAQAIQVFDVLGLGLGVNMYTDRANMTMLSPEGYVVGGTNNVNMVWNGNAYTSSSDYTGPGGSSNITASSTTLFFGYAWTAHDIQVFLPGSYSFDTALGGGAAESGMLSATVPLGQFGVHMLFDWNGNLNIDVFVVAAMNSEFGSGIGFTTQQTTYGLFKCGTGASGSQEIVNCLYDGKDWASGDIANKPAGDQTWMLASVDGNGDGIMGIPMNMGGPFPGFNANFNANMSPFPPATVPVPAAVWLFGSGLIGLLGIARRRRQ